MEKDTEKRKQKEMERNIINSCNLNGIIECKQKQKLSEKSLITVFKTASTDWIGFRPFLGPNEPFRLFSHHILCPTGPMKE